MSTFVLTGDNDLALSSGPLSQKTLTVETDPFVAAAYKVYNRFQLFLGEWFKDTRIGVPYFQTILKKNPDPAFARQVLRQVLLSVDAIAGVTTIDFQYDPVTRAASFYFEAFGDDGRKLTGGSGAPFIVGDKLITSQGVQL